MYEKTLCKIGAAIAHIWPKRIRVTTSEHNFGYFDRNPKELLRRFVTMGETWIHHYTPESREGSKQRVKPGENASKRPKTQQSSEKVMAGAFGMHME